MSSVAGTAGGIRAGRAFVELVMSDKFSASLKGAQKRLEEFGESAKEVGKQIATVAGIATTAFLASAKLFADMGSQLNDASIRTGASVEALSELQYAASLAGVSTEALEKSYRNLGKTLVAAQDGSLEAIQSLGELGLTASDVLGLSIDKQFDLIADRISSIEDPLIRSTMAMKLFGKGGTEILPLLNDGSKGMAELRERARALGLTISTDAAKAADEFGDSLDTLWATVKRLIFEVGGQVSRALHPLVRGLTNATAGLTGLIAKAPGLTIAVSGIAAAALGVGAALWGIGALAGAAVTISAGWVKVAAAFAAVSTVLATVWAWLGSVMAILIPLGKIVAAVAVVAVTSITAIVALIAALVAAVVAVAVYWEESWITMLDTFETFVTGVQKLWNSLKFGVLDAIGLSFDDQSAKDANAKLDQALQDSIKARRDAYDKAADAKAQADRKAEETSKTVAQKISGALESSAINRSSRGTFNKSNVLDLQGDNSIITRMARAAEVTAANTTKLANRPVQTLEFQ